MNGAILDREDIKLSLENYNSNNYSLALAQIQKVIDEGSKNSDKEAVSVGLALKSLYSYFVKNTPYNSIMTELYNANFLAETTDNQQIKDVINYAYAQILFEEKDFNMAERYFNVIKDRENNYFDYKNLHKLILSNTKDTDSTNPMIALLNIAKTISSKTNIDSLLKTITNETTNSLNAERCSVFLVDKTTHELWSKVATGIDFEEIRFPINKGLAGHVALTGETVNIKDAYSDERFNKEIDLQTGYHTRNILCMPIRNMHYEIIGVLQVLNKIGGCFSEDDEKILVTIGMNAGIAIENSRLFEKQEQMLRQQKALFNSFIDTLVASIDARDKITSGHSGRVKSYAKLICEQMNIDKSHSDLIEQAAILHDIGKIGIKDSVLQKEGKLTPEEYAHIQDHAKITYDILSKIYNTKDTEQIALIASSHHEKFNGTGYYRGLRNENIPLGGRILAIADVFDAITSKRHYRDKMPIKDVISIFLQDSDVHFDHNIVKHFLDISCDKIVEVFLSEKNQSLVDYAKNILSKQSLKQLYDILCLPETEITTEQKEFLTIFDKHY